ncbi:guanylate cyclase 32E [Rhipicephalus sanguineus]|uniref:guanylate cyclase 32E n=1 Tax=Rhipicephalus sanguineus TaxID=34632 RepID=UPI0020C4FAEF|nr:guanylate cyclase 32E [Rhipicephalus sanguineus]
MLQRAIAILLVILSRRSAYTRTNETIVLGYLTGSQRLPGDRSYRRPGLAISGALTLAVDKVNLRAPLMGGRRLDVLIAETFGRERHSVLQTARLWRQNVSAFIGPQETCVHEAFLAAALNLPMVSYFCLGRETSDKQRFPTFARTRPPETHISKSVAALLAHFGWRQVALFYASRLGHVADSVMSTLRSHGVRLRHVSSWNETYHYGYGPSPFETMLKDAAPKARVFIVLGQYFEHIGLMASLEARGLLQGGEYFVVGVDVQQYDVESPTRYLTGLFREEPDPSVVRAFRSYLGIVGSPASGFEEFSVAVNEYMQRPPFNIVNAADTIGGRKKIPSEGAYLYDAVMVYARAVNACVEHGGDFRNGKHLFEHMRGRSYQSAMGYMVRMDNNGDAEGNYTLIARRKYDDQSGSHYGLFPVGVFELSGNGSTLPVLKLFDTIEWIKGGPPRDEPTCGFSGEKCILGFAAYRYWAYEQALDRLLWKLDFNEIQMRGGPTAHQQAARQHRVRVHGGGSGPSDKSGGGLMPVPTSSQLSLSSHPEFRYSATVRSRRLSTGAACAPSKRSTTKYLLLTRTLKKQLNLLRELRHDNLCTLVGVCVEPPNICVVTDYCSRGSLRDLLDNEDIRLDNMFIASLVDDLVRGMLYLHDSPVRSHGDLRSANCLVDSRWVLKVADFGLAQIKHSAGDDGQHGSGQSQSREHKLLWRAPELLRDPDSPPEGTPRGDVYSFGVVLFEMLARSGPFGKTTLTPSEILERVRHPTLHQSVPDSEKQESDCFRPPLCELAEPWDVEYVRTLLTECWAEAPDQRPDFKAVRARLRHMRRGLKPSIVDNMLSMMETYATNLEALVDQRTDQLAQEKRRADALLYEMLPRTVADQLKRGKKVEAESFDSVTIYFSDIVGFTRLSAQSTPMEVVELLNDLYTCFDAVIENYAVYKVETIGDAYMVVGGLARHPDVAHASQVASMALHLLRSVRHFRIRHRPEEMLMLRVGMHSGPVCAGVVGRKMPRYCFFGDTVNTASRMESTGTPLKIHCSESCKQLLEKAGGYILEERGLVYIKAILSILT